MKLKPIGNHLIVKAVEPETKTASGIFIPDTANKERPEKGEVLAVGPGLLLETGARRQMDVAVGQVVVFKKYAPDEIKIDGVTYLIISDSDVMAIVE